MRFSALKERRWFTARGRNRGRSEVAQRAQRSSDLVVFTKPLPIWPTENVGTSVAPGDALESQAGSSFLKKCISMAIHPRQLCCTLYITFKGFLHLP